jgi:uncharacterized OB-fold protein
VAASRPITTGLFTTGADPRLLAARCGACERLHFPAADTCPYCAAASCERCEVGPDATLFLFTSVRTRPPGYRGPLPYAFGVVELPEGLRVVTRLLDVETAALREGLPMRLVVTPLFTDDDGTAVLSYGFAPAGS